jgi:L-threonylcarbamoyladenylate synthase
MAQSETILIDTPESFAKAVNRAARLLQDGLLAAVPTETVYGLAANALNEEAVRKIFHVKGRPAHNPLIVHVQGVGMAQQCVAEWPVLASQLAEAFWPGPLTLVLQRASIIPEIVVGGGPTVAVRYPAHPFIQALIRECGFPLAVPSANLSGQVSPTTALHVRQGLGDSVPLIVDGGPCAIGIESTVLDISTSPPVILRPGLIHSNAISALIGRLAVPEERPGNQMPKSPGNLPKHYAPKARLLVWKWENEHQLRGMLSRLGHSRDTIHLLCHSEIPLGTSVGQISVIPRDPEAFARALYAELHRGDQAGAEIIVVEAVPGSPEWEGVADRLRRAST